MPENDKNAIPEPDAPTEKVDLVKKPASGDTDVPAPEASVEAPAAQRKNQPDAARAPDATTTPVPSRGAAAPRRIEPRRVEPTPAAAERKSNRKWWAALITAVLVIAVIATGAYLLVDRDTTDESPEARIRVTVETFTRAVSDGDLAVLRDSSCGDLAAFYRDIPDAEFAAVHQASQQQGSIPTVDSIDAIQTTDDTTAIAQVIAHTAANPDDRSPRTFDLRLEGERWKVCG